MFSSHVEHISSLFLPHITWVQLQTIPNLSSVTKSIPIYHAHRCSQQSAEGLTLALSEYKLGWLPIREVESYVLPFLAVHCQGTITNYSKLFISDKSWVVA